MKLTSLGCVLKIASAFCVLFFHSQLWALQYALVIGGASKGAESSQHEFARVTAASTIGLNISGFDVTTLFGSGLNGQESTKYNKDYEKMKSIPGQRGSASDFAIDAAFESLIGKVHNGDSVEILISAHGADSCADLGTLIKNDVGSSCQHSFSVFDKNGQEIQYPSEKILQFVKRLENKGAKPNVVFSSCHSGRAKDAFKKSELKNSCVFFQSSGNELGYGCFEDDPDFSNDFTSSSEYLSMRYYKDALPTLEKDPYFFQSKCFQKTVKHFKEQKMDLTSISSAFWSSRKSDKTFQSSAISSLLNFEYFTKGIIHPQPLKDHCFDCEQTHILDTSLVKQLSNLGLQVSAAVAKPYDNSIIEYNKAVDELNLSIEKSEPPSKIFKRQSKLLKLANEVMTQERILVEQLFRQNESPSSDNPCTRPLK